jgi:myo-inositol-hexaphosphate 3-phosphohydrolase
MGAIVEKCKHLISSFNIVVFSYVRREANQIDDYLAKFAISNSSDFVWIEETPCIDVVVAID